METAILTTICRQRYTWNWIKKLSSPLLFVFDKNLSEEVIFEIWNVAIKTFLVRTDSYDHELMKILHNNKDDNINNKDD